MRRFNDALMEAGRGQQGPAASPPAAPSNDSASRSRGKHPPPDDGQPAAEQRPQLEGGETKWYTPEAFQQFYSPAGGKEYRSRWRAAGLWLKRAGFARGKRTTREHLEKALRRTVGPGEPEAKAAKATQQSNTSRPTQPQRQTATQRQQRPPDSPRPRNDGTHAAAPAQLEAQTAAAATRELLQRQHQFDAQAAKMEELSRQLQRLLDTNQRQSSALATEAQENEHIKKGILDYVSEVRRLRPQLTRSGSATASPVVHPVARPVAQIASECALHMLRILLLAWGPVEAVEGQRVPSRRQIWAELDSCARSLDSRQEAVQVEPRECQGTIDGNWTFQTVQEWLHRYFPLVHVTHSASPAPSGYVRLGAMLHTVLPSKAGDATRTEHWTALCPSGAGWVIADSLSCPGQSQGKVTPVSEQELLQPGNGKWFVWAPTLSAVQGLPEPTVRELAAGAAGPLGPGSAFSDVDIAHMPLDDLQQSLWSMQSRLLPSVPVVLGSRSPVPAASPVDSDTLPAAVSATAPTVTTQAGTALPTPLAPVPTGTATPVAPPPAAPLVAQAETPRAQPTGPALADADAAASPVSPAASVCPACLGKDGIICSQCAGSGVVQQTQQPQSMPLAQPVQSGLAPTATGTATPVMPQLIAMTTNAPNPSVISTAAHAVHDPTT
eukprot:gene1253-2717_t